MVYETTIINFGSVFIGMGVAIFIIFAAFFFFPPGNPAKSKHYRKYIVNLYVAGRVRQLAKKDNVDLKEEEKRFLKYESFGDKKRINDLDEQIEAELMKKVEKTYNKEETTDSEDKEKI